MKILNFFILIFFVSSFVKAELVQKKIFSLPTYKTVGGKTIQDVKIGWESYGTINKAKDNVILITHYFSGTSHAAGKYKDTDAQPGYWDSIIGPKKAIDTNEFYVISSDTLINLNVKDPNVTTTGPATINKKTGKPYALDFPIVTVRDFVNVQHELLKSLGIKKIHAVMGPSLGAMQALEWGITYPEFVDRIVMAIGTGEADAWLIGWLSLWADPIKIDSNWNNGNYYGKTEPYNGLLGSLKLIALHARHPLTVNEEFGRKWAKLDEDPLQAFNNKFAVEVGIEKWAIERATYIDPNHLLYMTKAVQNFIAGLGTSLEEALHKVKKPILLLPSSNDMLLFPEKSKDVLDVVAKQKGHVEYLELKGKSGHLNGLIAIDQASTAISKFLLKKNVN